MSYEFVTLLNNEIEKKKNQIATEETKITIWLRNHGTKQNRKIKLDGSN